MAAAISTEMVQRFCLLTQVNVPRRLLESSATTVLSNAMGIVPSSKKAFLAASCRLAKALNLLNPSPTVSQVMGTKSG
jgi:hypothetical protein